MAIEATTWSVMAMIIIAQTISGSDWTQMASLPFAFAAASFLIWSMVKLCQMLFDAGQKQAATTIETLRQQVASLQSAQTGQLTEMHTEMKLLHERSAAALTQNVDAISASVKAWSEVHEDLQAMIGYWKARPCLLESDRHEQIRGANEPRRTTRDRSADEESGRQNRT